MNRVPVKALREYRGLRQRLDKNLIGHDRNRWLKEFRKFCDRQPCWVLENDLLTYLGANLIPATTKSLTCNGNFAMFLAGDFRDFFIGKKEDPKPRTKLFRYNLKNYSTPRQIVTALGGEAATETTLAEIRYLMGRQTDGEAGILLVNIWANFFFVRDRIGVLRAVSVNRLKSGWRVDAFSLDVQISWAAGYQVFSRLPAQAGN